MQTESSRLIIPLPQAFTPVSVLLVSAAFGLKELTRKILLIVALISFGVALASYAEIDFELIGFLVQVRSSDALDNQSRSPSRLTL